MEESAGLGVPVAGVALVAGVLMLRWCRAGDIPDSVGTVAATANQMLQKILERVGLGGVAALCFGKGVLYGRIELKTTGIKNAATVDKSDPNRARKTLVLDLDDTLVHCFLDPPPWHRHLNAVKFVKKTVLLNRQRFGTLYIGLRPHLATFLAEAGQLFHLVVYTAGEKDYANAILAAVRDHAQADLHECYYRDSCKKLDGVYVKDLRLLRRDLTGVAILDDNPSSYAMQPENGILIRHWSGNPFDRELLDVLPLLHDIHRAEDVRDVLACG